VVPGLVLKCEILTMSNVHEYDTGISLYFSDERAKQFDQNMKKSGLTLSYAPECENVFTSIGNFPTNNRNQ
jgi:hypothetical protein